ncbi:G-type lectin S-receptor-like serine/threonine-protein kinase At2g19130 [Amaranthus tricolor]|uniref:G-type lectin S-receptor-like serine/threonine-protein kinase At2g19130 n=1 Tax=Amaranthus tricolor TaxID=29722 RepID=UPI00258898B6|nr:G-type lectin S-receptor-like serine/threonine-protein kinase At2g19130 [Amaranthus tricolor]
MHIKNKFKPNFCTILAVLCTVLTDLCLGDDMITANGSLTGDQTIISATGLFELGFFKPGNTSNYYIAIWYKKIPGKAIIWVANRDQPVSNKHTSKLEFWSDGNLVLLSNESKSSPIWSTNLSYNPSKSLKAVLLDDGNLVLRDGSNSKTPIWQSFDHPTDTLMPDGKLGLNKAKNTSQVLTSWKSLEDPGTGHYTIERDPNASQFIMLWNKTEQYWTSGLWIPNQQIFSLVPELRFLKTQLYSFSYVDNDNESYITYSVKNPSIVTRLVMDVSGQIKQLTWLDNAQQWVLFWTQPGQQCEAYAYCGAFAVCNQSSLPYCHCLHGFDPNSESEWNLNDYSGGCARKTKLSCETGEDTDKFLVSPSRVLPEHPHFDSARSIEECETACLRNCSCTAYAFDENGCYVWFVDLLNMRQQSDNSGKILYVRVAESDVRASGNKKLVMGVLVGLGMGLVAVFGLIYFVHWRGKRRLFVATKTMEHSLTRFSYRDLQSATRNFSQKLGGGGFGSVFKGMLPDSTPIAVKKLEKTSHNQGEKQFRAEVSAIGMIQHVNLVRLCGFCSEGSQRLLVYEYMPNGSLNTRLFNKEENFPVLNWRMRYQIATGTARGLAYLHEKCRDCIIHCDIKPENILLDAEFGPKVADFGLAKLVGREFSRVLTTIRGTRGYLAPEWISGDAVTAKADVYSYGMTLFEIISGRRNIHYATEGRLDFYPTWAMTKIIEGEDVLHIIDPRLEGDAEKEEVMRICKLACWCIQDEETQRPSMGQAVQVLEGILDIDMPSIPRSLQVFGGNAESPVFFSEFTSSQYSTERTDNASATLTSEDSSTYISASSILRSN